jgi:GT2 family glycosyltransferase
MKKVAIYCVNYHSKNRLEHYLQSIDQAVRAADGDVVLDVIAIDNSVPVEVIDYAPEAFALKVVKTGENKGYFGAVREGMKHVDPIAYDYSIISNVDVVMEEDFFVQLITAPTDKTLGWIAPQIYSDAEHRDRNPKIMRRYAKRKLQILRFFFSIPPLYNLYTHTAYKSKKLIKHEAGEIYAGHGSFIILTQEYFKRCGIIDYPVFLFCEEIYLGEQCLKQGLKVEYCPNIKVIDAEHASTSTFKRSKYCRYNFEALSYILKTYY